MTTVNEIWLVRHGRAGVDREYDCLTEQGFAQARALANYLNLMQIRFDGAFAGSLRRQQQTLSTICDNLAENNLKQIEVRETLNEFSPRQVYRVAARLRQQDPNFRSLFDQWQNNWSEAVERGKPQFFSVMRHFLDYWAAEPGEHGFQRWAASVLEGFSELPHSGRLLVVSSATPIALAAGAAFGLDAVESLRLLQPLYNSSITIIRRVRYAGRETLEPVMYNAVPHIQDPAMLTRL